MAEDACDVMAAVEDNMAENKDQGQLDDSILFKTIASGCTSEFLKLLRLCNHKTKHFSNHALNWAVFEACNKNHTDFLQFLLQDGSRLELRDDYGNTPLMICSAKGFLGIVGRLLRLGADVNAKNNNGDTALMVATSREVIQCLIEDSRLRLDEQNSTGNTALMSAIETSHLKKVKLLINAGANPNQTANKHSQSGLISLDDALVNNSNECAFDVAKRKGFSKLLELLYRAKLENVHPLKLAAVENDFETFLALLKYRLCDREETQNTRPDILCYVLKKINHWTIFNIRLIEKLCRLGVNVNKCQCCPMSPLEFVLNMGFYKVAKILCAYGANVTQDELFFALYWNRIQMIPLLINHGAPVNLYDQRGRWIYDGSALDIALEKSLISIASLLLYHGAALDPVWAVFKALRSKNSMTVDFLMKECVEVSKPETLIRAVELGNIELIQLLLDAGADIDGVHDNKTPLMSTIHIEVINFLLSKGAIVNLKTNTTPLINAISWDYLAADQRLNPKEMEEQLLLSIETFLKYGAVLEDTDEYGCTALIASIEKRIGLAVLKYLVEKGADVNRRNKNGLTALHIAVMTKQFDCAETLLKYGADVNLNCYVTADSGQDDIREKSALSIVLDQWLPCKKVQQMALVLIDQGASTELVRRDIIHRLIAAGNDGILIQKLMKSGICPKDIIVKNNILLETSVSPLAFSLILDRLDFVQYFFENWYLTGSDINILSRNENILNYLQQRNSEVLPYIKEVSRQPIKLELLCFIKVSSALGSDQGRRQRVHNSELPVVVQDQLLFSNLKHRVLRSVIAEFYYKWCL
ncbi:ankyrin repeat and KH domain-containing protein 1 [Biomphalaria glabrata]|nr:ankyrin repeat and KH domain-containing protein 1-like [Biomphalaria glabrata]